MAYPKEYDPEQLAAELRTSILRLSRNIKRDANLQGRSALDAEILSSILEQPGITTAELAASEQMSRPGMTSHIQRLVLQGYVRKTIAGPKDDGRYISLTITRAGKAFLINLTKGRSDWLAGRCALLSAQEISNLKQSIQPIRLILEHNGKSVSPPNVHLQRPTGSEK